MRLPEGYDPIAFGRAVGFARPVASDWAGSVLAGGSTLYEWARAQPDARVFSGRGEVFAIPSPADDTEWWVVRHYLRGGAVASVLQDRYFRQGATRLELELAACGAARGRGIATPDVLAGAVYHDGPFYRADIVTEFVDHARTLVDEVFEGPASDRSTEALRLAGSALRDLEDARILHRDLNARNVLIQHAAEGPRAWVLDLDRAEVVGKWARLPRSAMRRRLERSLRKFERIRGRALELSEWASFRAGYGDG